MSRSRLPVAHEARTRAEGVESVLVEEEVAAVAVARSNDFIMTIASVGHNLHAQLAELARVEARA